MGALDASCDRLARAGLLDGARLGAEQRARNRKDHDVPPGVEAVPRRRRARAGQERFRAHIYVGREWQNGVSAIDSNGRTIFIADAHRGDGKRFVVHADGKLTAFVELDSAVRGCGFLA